MKKKDNNLLSNHLLSFFKKSPKKKYNYRQLLSQLPYQVKNNEVKEALFLLEQRKKIKQINPGSYILNKTNKTLEGFLDKTNNGSGYIVRKEVEKDVYVSEKNMLNAFDGDLVQFVMISNREAKIINIKKRKKINFVGVTKIISNKLFVSTTGKKDKVDFIINEQKTIKENQLVVVGFLNWNNQYPEAKIIKIIGEQGLVDNEIHAILQEYNLPYEFSNDLIKEAESLKKLQNKEETKKRKDLRDINTITIDPDDAQDFDDAISVEIKQNKIEIGIHIADVSHFLKKDSILDKEAYKRGTSVYLVDRVVPMLPESLSNNLCSLRPKEDKYTFSALFTFNKKFQIEEQWFGKAVINSNQRLSYNEAQYIIENNTVIIPKEVSLSREMHHIEKEIKDSIILLNKIATDLRAKRINKGSILFNKKEVKFILNNEKEPIDTIVKESKASNKLVEEFMLLANKKVAEIFLKQKNKKNIYRIHDHPDEEKLIALERIIKNLGYKNRFESYKNLHQNINDLLKKVEKTPEKNLIDTLVIRSMSKAKYSSQNIGHFGLSFEKYTHFTSPIRRYPDVIVHRNLENILNNSQKQNKNLEDQCLYLSSREELSTKAERSSIKFMQVKYMSSKINKKYTGVVSGIMERGVFIEIKKNKCEGFIKAKDIPGDFFVFKEKEFLMMGRNTKEEYRLGDEVLVKVKGVNENKKQIDFLLLEKL
ncbi:MAG: ribonuclease R [Flavobacteriaceae bacterium]|nr:ribonuclease R [Flavobacteriaceae bacterium]